MARLTISLLGPPRVEVDGATLDVDTRKAVALLAYLGVTGRAHSRDALADLLWPESEPDSARAAFRRTLSVLKKGLGARWLLVTRDRVALGMDSVELDVIRFRDLVRRGRAAEAVALARGDFMEGFGLRDSASFEDWQLGEEQALRRELASALDRLAEECAACGELDAAVLHAHRRLALDPLQEASHRQLIRLYAAAGCRADALEQYRECVRVLDRELGVAPLAETSELYRAALEGDPPGPAAPVRKRGHTDGPTALPLSGRDVEWNQLRRALEAVGEGGQLVVIEGEPGLGKTRLADELFAYAIERGEPALAVRCHEGEGAVAYGVLVELLRSAAPSVGEWATATPSRALAEAARLVPELGEAADLPEVAPLEAPGARGAFLDGLSRVMPAAARLILVDDAQWADDASLDALTFLARRLPDRDACLVLTWRSSDVNSTHRLRRLLADARRLGGATAITLPPLDREAVQALVLAATGEPSHELTARVYSETHGVPLFVVEYLRAIGDTGVDEAVPSGLVELLRARLAALDETERQIVSAGAVLGRTFELETARDTSGRSDEETVAALEQLVRAGLLAESAEGYDFVHERLRTVAYDDLSLARRRLLHRRAAEALEPASRREPALAAIVAEHYRLAGRDDQAAEQFRLAGEHARRLYANAEALAHFRSALALGHGGVAELHEAIGDLETLLGDYRAALASYEAAVAMAVARQPELEHKLALVHHRRGEWALAASHLDAALASAREPALRARLLADMSLNEHRRNEPESARELASAALQEAAACSDQPALAQAHNISGMLAARAGDDTSAREHLERSLELARSLRDRAAEVAALNNLALVARDERDIAAALELTRAALELCALQGDRHREAALHNSVADLLHLEGRNDEAMQHLKQAVTLFAEVGGDPAEAQPEIWKLVEW